MKKIPVIIDTDPGVDDTVALLMSLAFEGYDIKAITTVGGNVELKYTAQNAKNIVQLAGKKVPVALGASKPLTKQLITAAHIHGIEGMGELVLEKSDEPFMEQEATEVIYEVAQKYSGELRLITLGPLTNLAQTIIKYPDVVNHIHSMVTMGGSMGVGNVTPAAEYNIYADPEAARIVFDSGLNITMVGLDVTIPTVVTPEHNLRIKSLKTPVADVVAQLNAYAIKKESPYNPTGAIMHDPLAAAIFMDPSIIETDYFHVDVECESPLTRGATLVDYYKVMGTKPNVHVALKADNQRFVELLIALLDSYSH